MKSLAELINESLLLEKENVFKNIYRKTITYGKNVKSCMSKIMNTQHEYDEFELKEDGILRYSNPYLFTGYILAKITKSKFGKLLSESDSIKIESHITGSAINFDMGDPIYLLKSVYNALISKDYKEFSYSIELENIDYTEESFEKDKK